MPSYLYHTIDVINNPKSWQREYVSMNSLTQAAKNTIMHVDPDYKSDVDLVATTHLHGLWIFSNRLQVEIDDIVVCPRYKMSHSEYIYYLLFIIYYLLFIIYYLLFIIYYLLFILDNSKRHTTQTTTFRRFLTGVLRAEADKWWNWTVCTSLCSLLSPSSSFCNSSV